MALTAVGSLAFDSVSTPFGERERMLGGSAVHFALAANFFTDVKVVSSVGEDFGENEIGVLSSRGIDTTDVERVEGGETFFWRGSYEYDMNIATTEETRLNVLESFDPKLTDGSRSSETLFLGNIQPHLQRRVRSECGDARFCALDSMNIWIENEKDTLVEAIGEVDCILLNDAEIRQLTGEANLARASRQVVDMGPKIVVAKQGEYGAVLFTEDTFFSIPGLPLENVKDPTGAGDSFAGGFLGYIDRHRDGLDEATLRRAMAYGSVLASFNVEEFGIERVAELEVGEIEERLLQFRQLTHFEIPD